MPAKRSGNGYNSTAYTPQLNSKAERLNRTLVDKTRALLYDSDLKKGNVRSTVYIDIFGANRSLLQTSWKPHRLKYGKRNKLDLKNL